MIDHYDAGNIFARILRKEIPCHVVQETEHTLTFQDIHPSAPIHWLMIPKGSYCTAGDFFANASDAEILDWSHSLASLIQRHGLEEPGYRCTTNAGAFGQQEVPHFHLHILSDALKTPCEMP